MDKEVLIKNIKDWIHLDEEIKELQRQIKEKRNEKKQNTETFAPDRPSRKSGVSAPHLIIIFLRP